MSLAAVLELGKVRYRLMFSMVVLVFMSGVVMKISIGYASAIAAALVLQSLEIGQSLGITGPNIMKTAMMQGGLGMVLSLLLITIPPMVMQFFSVSLGGGVSGYSPFSGKAPEGTGVGEARETEQATGNAQPGIDKDQDSQSVPRESIPSGSSGGTSGYNDLSPGNRGQAVSGPMAIGNARRAERLEQEADDYKRRLEAWENKQREVSN